MLTLLSLVNQAPKFVRRQSRFGNQKQAIESDRCMTDEFKLCIKETGNYLAKSIKTAHKEGKKLAECLYDELPAQCQNTASDTEPLICVVSYACSLLKRASDADSGVTNNTVGSKDVQLIHSLIDLVIYTTFRPSLEDGLGPRQKGTAGALGDLTSRTIGAQHTRDEILSTLLTIAQSKSIVARCLLSRHLADLLSTVLQSDHVSETSRFLELVSSIEAKVFLGTAVTLLHAQTPSWARTKITERMSKMITKPGGIRTITDFLLQGDVKAEVPMQRFDYLAALVAATPAKMQADEYLSRTVSQVLELYDDVSGMQRIYRQAASAILQNLFATHGSKMGTAMLNNFQDLCLLTPKVDTIQLKALHRLSMMTQDGRVSALLHNSLFEAVLAQNYLAFIAGNTETRDITDRLVYRFCETMTPEEISAAMVTLCSLKIPTELEVFSRAEDRKRTITAFLLRLFEQLKPISTLPFGLLLALCEDFKDLSEVQTQKIMLGVLAEVPGKYATTFLSHMTASEIFGRLEGVLLKSNQATQIVLLNIVKCILDTKPAVPLTGAQSLRSLQKTLCTLKDEELTSTAHALAQQLELLALQAETAAAQATTNTNDIQDSLKLYAAALQDMSDDIISNRAHGLYLISEIAQSPNRDILELPRIVQLILGLLTDDEPFVHQHAIKTISKMILVYKEELLSILHSSLANPSVPELAKERIRVAMQQ